MDFEYNNFIEDDFLCEEDQIKSIAKKTWLNTASTSLAHLEKVHANVYNFGIADPRDLKATNLRSRKLHPPGSPSGPPPDSPAGHSAVGTDRTNNKQQRSLKAWGSNSSIPESVKQNGCTALPKPTRPGSAKYSNSRTRPPSGKKPRPQSAKEPLPTGIVSEQAFGIKGAKYDPSGRPPKGTPSTCSIGWVGPPAGLKYPDRPPDGTPWQMDLPFDDETPALDNVSTNQRPESSIAPPPAPHGTPIPPSPEPAEEKTKRVFELFIGDPYKVPDISDEDKFESSDEDEMLYAPPTPSSYDQDSAYHTKESTQLDLNQEESHTPDKESLRLALPVADDDYDEMDDVDTERLLAEAESVSKQFNLKGIISANKNLPTKTDSSHKSLSSNGNTENDHMSVNNKKRAESLVSEIIDENGLHFEKNNTNNFMTSKSDKINEHEKSGVTFNENVTTVNITPRNIGRKVEELHPPKKRTVHHVTDNFVDLIEIKNRVEPVLTSAKAELSEKETAKIKPKTVSRPPSGKKLENSSYMNHQHSNKQSSSCGNSSSRNSTIKNSPHERSDTIQTKQRPSSAPTNRVAKAITTVTVDYGITEATNEEQENRRQKRKEKKNRDDVITMMETINLQDFNDGEYIDRCEHNDRRVQGHFEKKGQEVNSDATVKAVIDLVSAPTVYKSDPEKNYYEISRHSSMSNASVSDVKHEKVVPKSNTNHMLSKESSSVYKTTKTLEFDQDEPKEVTVKSVIDPQVVINREKEHCKPKSPEINRKKPPSRPSSAKPASNGTNHTMDEPERPGSRLGFVAMAPDSHLDTHSVSNKTVHGRPASAPSYRRPRSALKSDVKKTRSDKKEKLEGEPKELTEKDKVERDKVIDNLLERTRTLVDDADKDQEDLKDALKLPIKEKKKSRPSSAHVGLLSRKKDQELKAACVKRPSSATISTHKHYASYSHSGTNAGLSRGKKSTGKKRVVLTEPCIINTNKDLYDDEVTEEDLACLEMEQELTEKGLQISAATLQRALYPPSGKPGYYQITADLPKKPSLTLLSHPKVWLPEEYKRLQKAEKSLARANEVMFLQEKAEKRKAFLESLTPEQRKNLKKKGKKGKKGKRGGKLRRSQSAV